MKIRSLASSSCSHSLADVLERFSAYQQAENCPKYARAVCARITEFADHCRQHGAIMLEDVDISYIESWLGLCHKASRPSAWKSRHLAAQTFFNWGVFAGLMKSSENPMATSPRGATLTNKLMLTEFDVHRMLMVIPDTHIGIQDRLACMLLWHGCRLTDMNSLSVNDVPLFPADARSLAEQMLQARGHLRSTCLWMDYDGQGRTLHGQKLNKRLQQYAKCAELADPARVSTSLIYQSGNYYRLTCAEE